MEVFIKIGFQMLQNIFKILFLLTSTSSICSDNQPFFPLYNLLQKSTQESNSSKFLTVPLVRQSKNFSCGAAALQSLLAYYKILFREGQLIKLLNSNAVDGTSITKILDFIDLYNKSSIEERKKIHDLKSDDEEHKEAGTIPQKTPRVGSTTYSSAPNDDEITATKINYDVYRGKSSTAKNPMLNDIVADDGLDFKTLEDKYLKKGIPVMLAIQAYREDEKKPWKDEWDAGHFVIAIGFDEARYYFMDPSSAGQYTYLSKEELAQRWHDLDAEVIAGKSVNVPVRNFGLAIWLDITSRHDLGTVSHIH